MSRVLIVDDEATLLALLKRYLERQGHSVEIAPTAAAALELYGPGKFDVVIADLTLDGMNGEQVIAEMRRKDPTQPAIIASGYPFEPQLAGVRFLQKPFLPQTLVEMIQSAKR
jgi:CheY-like chemotaxis protein